MAVYDSIWLYIVCKWIANMMKVVKVTLFDRIGSVCEGVLWLLQSAVRPKIDKSVQIV